MSSQEENISDLQLTEEHLHALYIYIAMNYETFDEGEREYWRLIMEKIDPEFNDEKEY